MDSPEQGNTEKRKNEAGVGALLKASRLRVGGDLHEIADILRIRYVYMEAIEDGRYEALPGATYASGFIRAYAEHLGLDSQEVVRRFKNETAAGRDAELVFPEPIPESGVPGGAVVMIGILVAAVAYGAWYVNTSKNGALVELISPLPDRLARMIERDKPAAEKPAETAAATATAAGPAAPAPQPEAKPETAAKPEAAKPEATPEPKPEATAETASAPTPPATPGPTQAATETKPAPQPEAKPETPPAAAEAKPDAKPETPAAATAEAKPAPTPEPTPAAATETKPAPAPAVAEAPPSPTSQATPAPTPTAAQPTETPESRETPVATKRETPPEPLTAPVNVPVDLIPPPKPAAQAAPAAPAEPTPPATETAARPAPEPATEQASAPARPAEPDAKARIVVRAKVNSWIQVRDETAGELLVTRLLRAGDTYAIPDRAGLRLSTGNAGGLEILVDGEAVPAIGEEGAVRRNVLLDADKLKAGQAAGQ